MHIVLFVVLLLFFGVVILMDIWEDRCIQKCHEYRLRMLDRIRDLKRSGAIDDVTVIRLMRAVHDVPFENHVRMVMTRRDPATLYPSELDHAD